MNYPTPNRFTAEKLSSIPRLPFLSQSEQKLFESNSRVVSYNKGDVIFKQHTRTGNLMLVRTGLVKIYKESAFRKVMILKVAKPNEYIGLLSIYGHEYHQYSASAVDSCEICFIEADTATKLMSTNPRFTMELMKHISTKGLFIFDKLMNHYQKQLPGRIADVIIYFSQQIYERQSFEFPFTRQELAELACTTKESFIRTITEFKNDKIIDLKGKKVKIISNDILKKLSDLG